MAVLGGPGKRVDALGPRDLQQCYHRRKSDRRGLIIDAAFDRFPRGDRCRPEISEVLHGDGAGSPRAGLREDDEERDRARTGRRDGTSGGHSPIGGGQSDFKMQRTGRADRGQRDEGGFTNLSRVVLHRFQQEVKRGRGSGAG